MSRRVSATCGLATRVLDRPSRRVRLCEPDHASRLIRAGDRPGPVAGDRPDQGSRRGAATRSAVRVAGGPGIGSRDTRRDRCGIRVRGSTGSGTDAGITGAKVGSGSDAGSGTGSGPVAPGSGPVMPGSRRDVGRSGSGAEDRSRRGPGRSGRQAPACRMSTARHRGREGVRHAAGYPTRRRREPESLGRLDHEGPDRATPVCGTGTERRRGGQCQRHARGGGFAATDGPIATRSRWARRRPRPHKGRTNRLLFIFVVVEYRRIHRLAGELALQRAHIHRRGVVLQFASDSRLLRLLTAAPHGGPPCAYKRGGARRRPRNQVFVVAPAYNLSGAARGGGRPRPPLPAPAERPSRCPRPWSASIASGTSSAAPAGRPLPRTRPVAARRGRRSASISDLSSVLRTGRHALRPSGDGGSSSVGPDPAKDLQPDDHRATRPPRQTRPPGQTRSPGQTRPPDPDPITRPGPTTVSRPRSTLCVNRAHHPNYLAANVVIGLTGHRAPGRPV